MKYLNKMPKLENAHSHSHCALSLVLHVPDDKHPSVGYNYKVTPLSIQKCTWCSTITTGVSNNVYSHLLSNKTSKGQHSDLGRTNLLQSLPKIKCWCQQDQTLCGRTYMQQLECQHPGCTVSGGYQSLQYISPKILTTAMVNLIMTCKHWDYLNGTNDRQKVVENELIYCNCENTVEVT